MRQPLAYIHPAAKIAPGVVIDPFVTVDANVEIGEGTRILSGATILEGTRIGRNCTIFPGAVVGAIPQDLKFQGEDTLAVIGDNTTLRECVTVNRGTAAKGKTVVGSNCLIMAYSHVAHDCVVGDNVIISNATQLAGEVVVDSYAVIGGGTLVHQFCHLGSHVMIQGGALINKDVSSVREGRPRADRLYGCELDRTAPTRLLERDNPRHPGDLPLHLHEQSERERRRGTHRGRTAGDPRARRDTDVHPQLQARHHPRLFLLTNSVPGPEVCRPPYL